MTRRPGTHPALSVGDLVALPLADGRFGLVRVLETSRHDTLIEVLEGVFPDPPSMKEIGQLVRLRLRRLRYTGEPAVLYVTGPTPEGAITVGAVVPVPEEAAADASILGRWSSAANMALAEWRWEHDREAFLQDVKRREEARRRRWEVQQTTPPGNKAAPVLARSGRQAPARRGRPAEGGAEMGWWEEGAARILVGDEALDLLLEAFENVGKVYQAEWGREPTIKEWERLVAGSLLAREDSGGDDGAEVQVSISVSTEEPV